MILRMQSEKIQSCDQTKDAEDLEFNIILIDFNFINKSK